jgi:hypothetical protein
MYLCESTGLSMKEPLYSFHCVQFCLLMCIYRCNILYCVSACVMYAYECLLIMFCVMNISVVFDSLWSKHVTALCWPISP